MKAKIKLALVMPLQMLSAPEEVAEMPKTTTLTPEALDALGTEKPSLSLDERVREAIQLSGKDEELVKESLLKAEQNEYQRATKTFKTIPWDVFIEKNKKLSLDLGDSCYRLFQDGGHTQMKKRFYFMEDDSEYRVVLIIEDNSDNPVEVGLIPRSSIIKCPNFLTMSQWESIKVKPDQDSLPFQMPEYDLFEIQTEADWDKSFPHGAVVKIPNKYSKLIERIPSDTLFYALEQMRQNGYKNAMIRDFLSIKIFKAEALRSGRLRISKLLS